MESHFALLDELKRAHHALLDATDAFEAMLRRPAPDAVLLANVRLKLTSASGRRRNMLERTFSALGALPPGDMERVRQLRAEGVATILRSSQHIATWTSREVERNWRGYVNASLHVAPSVRISVRNEQRVLIPLLSVTETRNAA